MPDTSEGAGAREAEEGMAEGEMEERGGKQGYEAADHPNRRREQTE